MKLGNRIRKYRFENSEMSQHVLADAVGVTRQTIISIEKGRYVPSTLLSLRIARVFDTTVDEIFYIID